MISLFLGLIGSAMVITGWTFIIVFFRKRNHPEIADATHVERMMLGVIIETVGFLLLMLGLSGLASAL